jgi:hypothetical protein
LFQFSVLKCDIRLLTEKLQAFVIKFDTCSRCGYGSVEVVFNDCVSKEFGIEFFD